MRQSVNQQDSKRKKKTRRLSVKEHILRIDMTPLAGELFSLLTALIG